MTASNVNPPAFPQSFLDARRKADAAWEAERSAWAMVSANDNPTHDQILPWYDLWAAAFDAQAEFDRGVDQWRRDAKLR